VEPKGDSASRPTNANPTILLRRCFFTIRSPWRQSEHGIIPWRCKTIYITAIGRQSVNSIALLIHYITLFPAWYSEFAAYTTGAAVAKLAYAAGLKSAGDFPVVGSSPTSRTILIGLPLR
jgi:hypothetical protein